MTAKDHNKLLGILFLIWGGLQIIGVAVGVLVMLGMGGAIMTSVKPKEAVAIGAVFGLTIVILLVAMLFAIPSIVAGLKMRKGNQSARTWAIIAAILAVLNFPLGTALGVYALWFLFGEQGKSFYPGNTATGAISPPPPNSWQ